MTRGSVKTRANLCQNACEFTYRRTEQSSCTSMRRRTRRCRENYGEFFHILPFVKCRVCRPWTGYAAVLPSTSSCASKRYPVAIATVPIPSAACRTLRRNPAPPHPVAQPVHRPVVSRVANQVAVRNVHAAVHARQLIRRRRVLRVRRTAKPPAELPHNNTFQRTCRIHVFSHLNHPPRQSAELQR